MHHGQEPDDFCPSCGVPVPFQRRGDTCPHCGHDFRVPADDPAHGGHLSTFGCGLCGLIAGAQLGAAVAFTDPGIRLDDPRLVLFPAIAGVACMGATAWVGGRLRLGVQRGYEAGLVALMLAAFVVLFLSVGGVSSPDTLAAIGFCALIVISLLVWRVLYSRDRPPGHVGP